MAELINITDGDILDVIDIPAITQNLPPELAASVGTLLTIFKAVGIVLIIYLIFLTISIIFNLKRYKLIKKTWTKVQEIEEKLDKILNKNKPKEEKEERKEKPEDEKEK